MLLDRVLLAFPTEGGRTPILPEQSELEHLNATFNARLHEEPHDRREIIAPRRDA